MRNKSKTFWYHIRSAFRVLSAEFLGNPPPYDVATDEFLARNLELSAKEIFRPQIHFRAATLLSIALAILAILGADSIKGLIDLIPWHETQHILNDYRNPELVFLCVAFSLITMSIFVRSARSLAWAMAQSSLLRRITVSGGGTLMILFCRQIWPAFQTEIATIAEFTLVFLLVQGVFFTEIPEPEEENDELHRAYFVDRIIDYLKSKPSVRLRTVAVFGTWGAGKTTVLRMLKAKLQSCEYKKAFRVASVNPWMARSPEEARFMVAEAFDQALGLLANTAPRYRRSNWLNWFGGIKSVIGFGVTVDVAKLIEGDTSEQEKLLVEKINQRLQPLKATLVILIDDMERADAEIVKKLFPFIMRLTEIKSCFFVFAIDPERISVAFKETSRGGVETKGYLDKVFGLQFELPEPRQQDIVQMCRNLIDKIKTPKLATAFDQIEEYLPTNPRAIIRFLRDAQANETLFLWRFDPDEFRYDIFFTIRLLELEIPGFSESLRKADVIGIIKEYHGIRHLKSVGFGKDKNPNDCLERLWTKIVGESKDRFQNGERLKKALYFIVEYKDDFDWETRDYMRLLVPSRSERDRLENLWLEKAGHASLSAMLCDSLPELNYADRDDSAAYFIQDQFQKYFNLRATITKEQVLQIDNINIEFAASNIERLKRHLDFSLGSKLEFDLGAYTDERFEDFGNVVFSAPIDNNRLCSLEDALLRSLLNNLSDKALYEFTRERNKTAFWLHQSSQNEHRGFIEQFITEGKINFRHRIFSYFRTGSFLNWTHTGKFPTSSTLELFCTPLNWLASSDSAEFDLLERLAHEGASNVGISIAFGTLGRLILSELIAGALGQYQSYAKELVHTIKSYPRYVPIIWKGALHDAQNKSLLISGRAELKRLWSTFKDSEGTIDIAFPKWPMLDGSVDPLQSTNCDGERPLSPAFTPSIAAVDEPTKEELDSGSLVHGNECQKQ